MMSGDFVERDPFAQSKHELDVIAQTVRSWTIGFVDDKYVGDFHNARFERLDRVSGLGNENEQCRIGSARNIQLRLSNADRFDEDAVEAKCIAYVGDFPGCGGQSAE